MQRRDRAKRARIIIIGNHLCRARNKPARVPCGKQVCERPRRGNLRRRRRRAHARKSERRDKRKPEKEKRREKEEKTRAEPESITEATTRERKKSRVYTPSRVVYRAAVGTSTVGKSKRARKRASKRKSERARGIYRNSAELREERRASLLRWLLPLLSGYHAYMYTCMYVCTEARRRGE